MPLKFTHITLLSERYKVYLKTIAQTKAMPEAVRWHQNN